MWFSAKVTHSRSCWCISSISSTLNIHTIFLGIILKCLSPFQDLVQLVNADQPFWLVGLTEMTRTFGLELLELIFSSFPDVFFKVTRKKNYVAIMLTFPFFQHEEFSFLVKERVCPLVIKLFSPNIKHRPGLPAATVQHSQDKPFFPISIRLLRIVSVLLEKFYTMLVSIFFSKFWVEMNIKRNSL